MMRIHFATCVLLISVMMNKASAELVLSGKQAKVDRSSIACRDVADLSRVKQLAIAGDAEAAATYAESKNCKSLKAGSTGLVEDISALRASTCIRVRGEPDCYWFPTPFISAAAPSE